MQYILYRRIKGSIAFFLLLTLNIIATADSSLLMSDQYYQRYMLYRDKKVIQDAYYLLVNCESEYKDSFDFNWRMARILNEYAFLFKDPISYFEKGLIYTNKAIAKNPNREEGYFWRAVLLGQIGQHKGIIKSINTAYEMKATLEKCLEINPNNPYTYHILATLYLKVPPYLFFGNKYQALELAKKAVELEPRSSNLWWGLYLAYIEVNQKEEAKQILQKILTLPDNDPLNLEYNQPFPLDIKDKAVKILHQ